MVLDDELLIFAAIPSPAPAFIRPAEAKGEVDLLVLRPCLDRRFQQRLAAEPIEIEAKTFETVLMGERGLPPADAAIAAKVIIAEFTRTARLAMPLKLRPRAADVCPFCEALAPPAIILRDGMELGQVECDCTGDQMIRPGQGRGIDIPGGPAFRSGFSRLPEFRDLGELGRFACRVDRPVPVAGTPGHKEWQPLEHESQRACPVRLGDWQILPSFPETLGKLPAHVHQRVFRGSPPRHLFPRSVSRDGLAEPCFT